MRRKAVTAGAITGIAAFAIGAAALTPNAARKATASSHREAPLIANDPTADLTDLYAFMSPGKTDTVTLMANVIPIEIPAEGPNYYNLDDTVRYRIEVDNNGDGKGDLHYALRTRTRQRAGHVPVQHRPGHVAERPRPGGQAALDADARQGQRGGPRDRPRHHRAEQRRQDLDAELRGAGGLGRQDRQGNVKAFVGPREDPFAIDVGRIFDFLSVGGPGTDNLAGVNVHTIALEVPAKVLRRSNAQPVIGVWAATDRRVSADRHAPPARPAACTSASPQWKQVERLGQPLVNEVLIPRTKKDYWNTQTPAQDKQFEKYYTAPGLVKALNARVFGPILQGAGVVPEPEQLPGARAGDRPRRHLGDPAPRLRLRARCGRPDVRQGRVRQEARRRAAPEHEDAADRHPVGHRRSPRPALQLPDAGHRPARPDAARARHPAVHAAVRRLPERSPPR